ncbi:hypothetical protein AB0I28_23995 [Phytomonospora sp. NPDC050363]|uniref:hypothetical protein n=1 Tax=Phytomonospora sp. NPDC050363 TaxID=3155642 RepID=UPI0033F09158
MKATAAGTKRVSSAGLVCHREGHRPRLIYRIRPYRGRKGEAKSFTEHDYTRLLDQAHQQLGAPIVLAWDNLNTTATPRCAS